VRRLIKIFLVFLFASTAGTGWAQNFVCPSEDPNRNIFKSKIYDNGIISFEPSSDKNNPIDFNLYKKEANGNCNKIKIDSYPVEGSKPKIETVFYKKIRGQQNIVVLVSWELNNRAAGTYGTLYQVYAYADIKGLLTENEEVSNNKIMSGIEGYADGASSSFSGKDAAHVRLLLDQIK